jgi:transcriptional regulator with XRE-family HTH domain
MPTLGEKLKLLRKEMGLRQSDVVGEALSRTSLSKLENDLTKPSIETLEYLSMRFKKPVAYFFDHPNDLANPNHKREIYYTELLQTITYGQVALLEAYLAESHPKNLSDEDPFKGRSNQAIAGFYMEHGQYEKANEYIKLAISQLELYGDLYHLSKAKLILGDLCLNQNQQSLALSIFKEGLSDLRHSFISDYALETRFLLNIAVGLKLENQPIDSINTLQDALRLADTHLIYTYTGQILSKLAQLQSEIGDVNSAIRTSRRRCYLYEFTGATKKLNETYIELSNYYYSCQSYKEAQDLINLARSYFTDEDAFKLKIHVQESLLHIQLHHIKAFERDLTKEVWIAFSEKELLQWLTAMKDNLKKLAISSAKLQALKESIIKTRSTEKESLAILAETYTQLGDFETAFTLLKLAR